MDAVIAYNSLPQQALNATPYALVFGAQLHPMALRPFAPAIDETERRGMILYEACVRFLENETTCALRAQVAPRAINLSWQRRVGPPLLMAPLCQADLRNTGLLDRPSHWC
eukprot:Protomagalhaensia_wolfi_Nauph_80__5348@NODE_580_length_2260_cov_13_177398_g435_i0_p2_GENE_NODE_580_length_2260_cov_13_177398_g435_i0NODE_580_length_2260_cov_13_177398_g435_i0_p2_ORF_typecomplete_len111_score9_19_NODE_580_length_2260_cov_13_177398_g435_i012131545